MKEMEIDGEEEEIREEFRKKIRGIKGFQEKEKKEKEDRNDNGRKKEGNNMEEKWKNTGREERREKMNHELFHVVNSRPKSKKKKKDNEIMHDAVRVH